MVSPRGPQLLKLASKVPTGIWACRELEVPGAEKKNAYVL